jgi:hypothetical protein
MSWLSVLYKALKGGKTDVDFWASVLTGTLNSNQRNHMARMMSDTLWICTIASTVSTDPRIEQVKAFAAKGLDELEQ